MSSPQHDDRPTNGQALWRLAELDAIYDSAPVGLCVLDAELRYVRINDRLADINGQPAAAHIGRTVREMVPALADAAEPAMRRVLQTGEPALGIEIVGETAAQPGVERVWIESWHPIRNAAGVVVGINVVVEEVTERKRAESALLLLGEASRALAESLDVGAILATLGRVAVPQLADWALVEAFHGDLTPDHVVVRHRDEAKAALGREATLRYAPDRNPHHPLARVLATGHTELLREIPDSLLRQIARDAGQAAWLRSLALRSAIIVPLVARGRTVGALALATAESGRQYREQDVPLVEELARRAALAIDNARLYSDLRQEARRKDEFLAMLAHELRNPLAPILNAVTVLDRVAAQADIAVRLRGIIARQTRHLGRLVDDLLDVARLSSGKVLLRRQPLDLRDAVRRSVEALGQGGRVRDHALTIALPGEPVLIDADPLRMEQVVSNLVENAVKYTPAGRAIRLTVGREDAGAFLRVHDEGVGIEPDLLRQVFEPFVQAEQSAARSTGGLGLGLALVRGLVEQHGGTVAAHSDGVGHGSEFVVRLPLAPGAEAAAALPEAPRGQRALDILLIEDSDDARAALRALLESDGHRVETARDGPEGLAIAARAKPEVVLIDIGLPRMDGHEVARRLRALPDVPTPRLVAITGYGQPEDRRRSDEAGFDAHLVKPVGGAELADVLAGLTAAG
jgi:PAS domain S-box-containing protein